MTGSARGRRDQTLTVHEIVQIYAVSVARDVLLGDNKGAKVQFLSRYPFLFTYRQTIQVEEQTNFNGSNILGTVETCI